MARHIGVSREWLSKLENGKEPISDFVAMKLDAFTRGDVNSHHIGAVAEAPAAYGDHPGIVSEIEQHNAALLSRAGRDPVRLGWIREQQRAHLAIPAHWAESSPRPPKQSAISEIADELDRQHQANFKRARSDPAFHALHAGKK